MNGRPTEAKRSTVVSRLNMVKASKCIRNVDLSKSKETWKALEQFLFLIQVAVSLLPVVHPPIANPACRIEHVKTHAAICLFHALTCFDFHTYTFNIYVTRLDLELSMASRKSRAHQISPLLDLCSGIVVSLHCTKKTVSHSSPGSQQEVMR